MLEDLKQEVLACAQQADRSGLCRHRSGNFSIRDEKSGLICITPTGADREEMTAADIVVADSQARVVESKTGLRPTSETLMHLAVYNSRPEIMAIAHTHSRFATSFAILNKKIPAIVYEIFMLGCRDGYVPVDPYGRPGTKALAESVLKPLLIADVALMQAHGAIAIDQSSLKEALLKASYLEELAEMYYHTLLVGGQEPPQVPAEELKKWAYPAEITLKQ